MIDITPHKLRQAADIKERIDALQNQLNEILGGEASTPAADTDQPKEYKFSAVARARMRKAQKARWAKIKGAAPATEPVKRRKRKMSAAGLANIRAGVAKRMAKMGAKAPAAKQLKGAKKKFSPAARAALATAAKARWAKAKAQGKSRL